MYRLSDVYRVTGDAYPNCLYSYIHVSSINPSRELWKSLSRERLFIFQWFESGSGYPIRTSQYCTYWNCRVHFRFYKCCIKAVFSNLKTETFNSQSRFNEMSGLFNTFQIVSTKYFYLLPSTHRASETCTYQIDFPLLKW